MLVPHRRRIARAALLDLLSGRLQIALKLADLTLGLIELAIHGLLELQARSLQDGELASIHDVKHGPLKDKTQNDDDNPQECVHV